MRGARLHAPAVWLADVGVVGATLAGAVALAAASVASAYFLDPLVVPLLVAAAGFALATLYRPAIGLGAALLMTPLELVSVDLLGGGISPTDAMFAIVAAAWACRALYRAESIVMPSQRDIPVLVLLGTVAIGITVAADPTPVVRVLVTWTFFYIAYLQAQSLSDSEIKAVLVAFLVGAGVLGAIGAIGYLQSSEQGLLEGGNTTLARAEGTFGNPNAYGALLVLALLPGLALALASVRRGWLAVPLAFGLAGLAFSLSRGAILTFAVGLAVLLTWRRARWFAVALAATLGLLMVLNTGAVTDSARLEVVRERLSSVNTQQLEVSDRPAIWEVALDVARENPLIGVGMNQFQFEAATRGLTQRGVPYENAHSLPLSLAAETGLIGMLAFVAFAGQLLARGLKLIRLAPANELAYPLGLGLVAALTAFLLQGLTVVQLRTPILAAAFFVLAGILTGLATRVSAAAAADRASGEAPAPSGGRPAAGAATPPSGTESRASSAGS